MNRRVDILFVGLLGAVGASVARAEDRADDSGEVVVEADHPADSPSTRRLDRAAVEATPGRSADELLRAMPGLHVSQHGGRGKAMQFFLRGFDAVHGSDLSIEVDGVPLNEPGNVHAHGYLDLYLLPPSLIRGLTLSPGPRRAEDGDFAVAGSAQFELGLESPGVWADLGGGTDRSVLATATARPQDSDSATFFVVDSDIGQGVGDHRQWRQLRAAAGWGGSLGTTSARAWILAYDGRFESPGVVREDDVADGELDFRGAYPGSGGGRSSRVLASGTVSKGSTDQAFRVTVYGGARALSLTQNYTGFYENVDEGDGTTQSHTAYTGGARAWYGRSLSPKLRLRAGGGTRLDVLELTQDQVRTDGTVWDAGPPLQATTANVSAWTALPAAPTRWLLVEPGVHTALFGVATSESALAVAPVVAPSASVTVGPDAPVTGRAAYARSFRSPDPRGTGDDGTVAVAKADSTEVGLHATPLSWLALRTVGFLTTVSDEVVFDHLQARYLASGASVRRGVDGGFTVQPNDFLELGADFTLSDARYSATNERIPYAPTQLYVVHAGTQRLPIGSVGLTTGLRGWHLAPRPLPEGYASPSATVLDFTSQVDGDRWRVSFDVDNVLGSDWWDGTFVYPSDWGGGDAGNPVSHLPVRHITAGSARAARLVLGWKLR